MSSDLVARAREVSIETEDDYRRAHDIMSLAKDFIAAAKAKYAAVKKSAHETHALAVSLEKQDTEVAKEAISILEPKCLAWDEKRIEEKRASELEALEMYNEGLMAPPAKEEVKVDGVSKTGSYEAVVDDLLLLVKHVAENPDDVTLLMADMTMINKRARALGKALKLPGVRVVKKAGYRHKRKGR